ncbi:MAG: PEP-CTERM sorting domain-containing protein [Caldilineaceae bacterium]|jgi:outer membrane biosynthesis protein TonB
MNRHLLRRSYIVLAVIFLFSFTLLSVQFGAVDVAAGKSLAVDTPIPTQPPPTNTPVPPTEEPTKEPTIPPPPTVTPTAPPTPLPPAEIPEPITVILFGTGLAALSAAAARRKKTE